MGSCKSCTCGTAKVLEFTLTDAGLEKFKEQECCKCCAQKVTTFECKDLERFCADVGIGGVMLKGSDHA